MQECGKCHKLKSIEEFYPFKEQSWRFNRCKECEKQYRREYYKKTRDKKLITIRKYNATYFKTEKGKKAVNEAAKRAYKKFPEKFAARLKLREAVRKGKIDKPDFCTVCFEKKPKIEGHHYAGYEGDNWNKVMWLCSRHHADEHVRIRGNLRVK